MSVKFSVHKKEYRSFLSFFWISRYQGWIEGPSGPSIDILFIFSKAVISDCKALFLANYDKKS